MPFFEPVHFASSFSSTPTAPPRRAPRKKMLAGLLAQHLPALVWFKLVNDTVPEPYLDEVFHVRQAQHYCRSEFSVWDPKITTPPGLYLVSYLLSPLLGCSVVSLRALSLLCLAGVFCVVYRIYVQRQHSSSSRSWQSTFLLHHHLTLNITLFPPLFFFSALYYTDVASTLSVLLFYSCFLSSLDRGITIPRLASLVLLGVTSLTFRQTNIFWVAIFPAGITLVRELDRGHHVVKDSMFRRVEGFGDSMMSIARTSLKMDVIYDPSVRDAWVEDYIKTTLTLLTTTLKTLTTPTRLAPLLKALSPSLTLLTLFAAFIAYNGSVVLGDKSNHVATLHTPQLLYLWPYLTFFTWPLLYPHLSTLFFAATLARLPAFAPLESMLIFRRRRLVPRLWVAGSFTLVAGLMVRFNTIVHPFILADNRHYTFYLFRWLTRPWWVKFTVVPVYVVCGWACVQALGARVFPSSSSRRQKRPSTDEATGVSSSQRNDDDGKNSPRHSSPDARRGRGGMEKEQGRNIPNGTTTTATTSFLLIWLGTTTLQLITAPLVEPRYFILPWIFWRMHLPLPQQYQPSDEDSDGGGGGGGAVAKGFLGEWRENLDHRLVLETLWFVLVNVVTGWVFLRWGFEWKQEVGRVQRFMW